MVFLALFFEGTSQADGGFSSASVPETATTLVEAVINTVLTPLGTSVDMSSQEAKRLVILAKEDARIYLLTGEATEQLREVIFFLRERSSQLEMTEVIQVSDDELIREIYIFEPSSAQ